MENMNSTLWFGGRTQSNVAKEKAKQCAHPTQNITAGSCVHAIPLQGRGKRYSDVLWESQVLPRLEFSGSINAF